MTRLLDAALAYAGRGWPVFPCHGWTGTICSCGHRDCDSPAKHPRTGHGLLDATTDPARVRGWWARWPHANIGLRTGVAFDVLDVDGPDGEAALPRDLPDSETVDGPTVETGKGWHVYLTPTGLGNRTGLLAHVDWRGNGGYVIAPPSMHPSGRRYRWELPASPTFGPKSQLRPPPTWLLNLLDPPRTPAAVPAARGMSTTDTYGQRALESELGRLAVAPDGERNKHLYRAAIRLGQLVVARQLDAGEVVEALVAVGRRIGLADREVEGTALSGLRFGMENPR
jgi:hypothetical protein